MRVALRALFAAALLVSSAAPARAVDATAALLDELDRCDVAITSAPRLDVLLALADGRSALEVKEVLKGPRRCIGYVTTFGEGDDELVFVGGRPPIGSTGALLWVDRGWWRIAAIPLGYISGTRVVYRYGDTRELFAPIGSTGSAGTIGVVGVRLVGASASVILHLMPGGEIPGLRLLDPDHVLVQGRLTSDPLFRWGSHPMWPYGAQWLFERRGDRFVEVAARQSRDPYYVMTGLVGALFDRDASTMRRFATDDAVAQALALPAMDRRIDPLHLIAPADFLLREHMSWSALPPDVRTEAPAGPVWGTFTHYDARSRPLLEVLLRFERDQEGWIVTSVYQLWPRDPSEPEITR